MFFSPTYRSVEVAARGHVKNAASYGQEYRGIVQSIKLEEGLRRICAEDNRGGAAREADGLLWAEVVVENDNKQRGEDKVNRGGDRSPTMPVRW